MNYSNHSVTTLAHVTPAQSPQPASLFAYVWRFVINAAIVKQLEVKDSTKIQHPEAENISVDFVRTTRKKRELTGQWHLVHDKLVCQWHVAER